MDSTTNMPNSNVDITFGCLFISVVITSAVWGVGCLQFYLYCEKYWNTEKRWIKLYMAALCIMDTVHQVLIANVTYVPFVKGIADPILLLRFQRTTSAILGLTAFIDAMVQAILVRRAWYLSNKNRILTGALSIAVLAQFALTMVLFVQSVIIGKLPMLHKNIPLQLAVSVVAGFTDTYLAVVLVRLLRKARSGFRRSDSIVNRLATYTVGSSLVTAICALVALISAAVAPHSYIYLLSDLLLPKFYFNCLLASLNSRSSLRAAANQESGSMSIHFENPPSSSSGESSSSANASSKTSTLPVEANECRFNVDIEMGPDRTTVKLH